MVGRNAQDSLAERVLRPLGNPKDWLKLPTIFKAFMVDSRERDCNYRPQ